MNKDVEFRAWIKAENRMETCIDVNPFYISDCDRYHWKHEDVELMQYVKVKDKNEKKVFEGDIVRCWGGEYWEGYWEHNETIVVDDISDPFTMLELTENEYIEVIGDMYNNKDLLVRCKNKIV